MTFDKYSTFMNVLCAAENVPTLNHYFAAEAFKYALKGEKKEVAYHLSKIEHPKIKREVCSTIELLDNKSIDEPTIEMIMAFHGMLSLGRACVCQHGMLEMIEELEEELYELEFFPEEMPMTNLIL